MSEFRCIWCGRGQPEVAFDESHVLPRALGNAGLQILPPGTVCRPCNGYFGTKLEPVFMDHPLTHLTAVMLEVKDPGDGLAFRKLFFDDGHPSITPVNRALATHIDVADGRIDYNVTITITGRIRRQADPRALALWSRAIHKIAFENLAWSASRPNATYPVDVHSSVFDPVRLWAREGRPPRPVRPMLWQAPTGISTRFGSDIWVYGDDWGVDLDIFEQRYGVSLTSPATKAKSDIRAWAEARGLDLNLRLMISDSIGRG